MDLQYNNELTPEILARMDQSPFTAEQLHRMNDEARALIEGQQEYCRQRPYTPYRIAVDGSCSDNGDEIISTLSNGQMIVRPEGEMMPEDFLSSHEVR